MVYCGKPSRGCQNCKTRRIKCDEARPDCVQCRRSGRTCPGYPNELDLIFRNETTAVRRRAQKSNLSRGKSPLKAKQKSQSSNIHVTSAPVALISAPTISSDTDTDFEEEDLFSEYGARATALGTLITNPYNIESSIGSSSPSSSSLSPIFEINSPSQLSTHSSIWSTSEVAVVTPIYEQIQSPSWINPASPTQVVSSPPKSSSPGFRQQYLATCLDPVYNDSLIWGINLPQEAFAVTYFFKNHVIRNRHEDSQRSFIELLVALYDSADLSSLLHKAIYAVSLTLLANAQKDNKLRTESKKQYSRALKDLSSAIRDPRTATLDETVATVLLFSLCEQISPTQMGKTAWASHITGAVALVKLRGRKQLRNPMSRRLFNAVRAHTVVACMHTSYPVEDFPDALGWKCDDGMDCNGANALTRIAIPIGAIRNRSKTCLAADKTPDTLAEMLQIMEEAREVDRNLEAWYQNLSDVWTPKVTMVTAEEGDDVRNAEFWPGPQFIYTDLSVAHIICDYRVCRIYCQSVVRELYNALPATSRSSYVDQIFVEAVLITQQTVNDFSSTIPYFLGYGKESRDDCATEVDHESAMAVGAYFVGPPLFLSINVVCVPVAQRQWLVGRLRTICRKYGQIEEKTLVFYEGLLRLNVTTLPSSGSCTAEAAPLLDPKCLGISRQIA